MPLGAFALEPRLRARPCGGRPYHSVALRAPGLSASSGDRRCVTLDRREGVVDMIYLVLLVVGLVTWAAVRWIPARNDVVRLGVGFAVFGALTTLVMWWMVVPEVILVAGLVMVGVGFSRPATRTV